MRRKLIWSSCVFAVAIAIGICTNQLVYGLIGAAQEMTVEIYDAINDNDEPKAIEKLTALASLWDEQKPLMEMLTSHEDLHDVAIQCASAKAQLEDGNMPNFMLAMAELTEMLEHLYDQETLSWSNIF